MNQIAVDTGVLVITAAGSSGSESLTDLSIIGVPSSQFSRWPGVAGFPQRFSPQSQKVWISMVSDPEFKKQLRAWGSLDLAWHNAIIEFLRRCEAEGVSPFKDDTDSAKNDYVREYLRSARLTIVKFFDETGFFQRVRVRKAFREYKRGDTGLTFESWAELYRVKDPTFEKWLNQVPSPRFLRGVDNRWSKVLAPNITVWVRYVNENHAVVGYSIKVPGTIVVPGKRTPKRKEVDRWLDQQLVLPVIRAARLRDVSNRLF
jgi:hypothetical protein